MVTRVPEPEIKKHIRVGIGVITHGDEVLICQRFTDAALGGLWEFPGGKIEPNETPEAAVIREVREELGVDVIVTHALASLTHDYAHATVTLHPFVCRLDDASHTRSPRAIGCAQWKWVTRSTLKDHDFPPANDALLDVLMSDATQAT